MTFPFTLPDWVPPWVGFLALVVAAFLALAFAFMPFSVFGVKGRLDVIEARLDEIQQEIRSLALRLPEPSRFEYAPEDRRRWAEPERRPPIPPRAVSSDPDYDPPPPPPGRRVPPGRGSRSEPRFDQD